MQTSLHVFFARACVHISVLRECVWHGVHHVLLNALHVNSDRSAYTDSVVHIPGVRVFVSVYVCVCKRERERECSNSVVSIIQVAVYM